MKIRFQADADLRRPIITGLKRREPAIDFKTAQEAGLAGLDDLTVLGMAADEGRMLVSHDVSTMPENFVRFIQTRTSPGVILIHSNCLITRPLRDYFACGLPPKLRTGRILPR